MFALNVLISMASPHWLLIWHTAFEHQSTNIVDMVGNYLLFLWVATMSGKLKILICSQNKLYVVMEMATVHSSWDIHLTLRDFFCFFFASVAIWLKLHIIGFAYSFIKSIVLQKNAPSYDFLFQLLPFPWKEIGPFTR